MTIQTNLTEEILQQAKDALSNGDPVEEMNESIRHKQYFERWFDDVKESRKSICTVAGKEHAPVYEDDSSGIIYKATCTRCGQVKTHGEFGWEIIQQGKRK